MQYYKIIGIYKGDGTIEVNHYTFSGQTLKLQSKIHSSNLYYCQSNEIAYFSNSSELKAEEE